MRSLKYHAALATLAMCLAIAPKAHAALMISVDGMTASASTNTFASFMGAVGTFNISHITMTGVDTFSGNGMLVDNGSLNISSSGTGTLTILLTETDLNLGSFGSFTGQFTGILTNATAIRSFYIDPTNNGLLTDLLGSTTTGSGSFAKEPGLSGPFSLTEQIILTATGRGATLSSDDGVMAPEPTSLVLLGAGLVGMGIAGRRRRK